MWTRIREQIEGMLRDDSVGLEVRVFRVFCATTCALCLGVVLPMNVVQTMPAVVNLAVAMMGAFAGYCYWASLRGRHLRYALIVSFVLVLNPVWFLNAGSEGSIPYYFFPVILYPLAVFRGWARVLLTTAIVLDFCALLIVEAQFPHWLVRFSTSSDRWFDLIIGAFCSSLAVAAVVRLLLAAYERERERLAATVARLESSERNYREIFNATSEALAIRDREGRLIDANGQMCAMFGGDRAALDRLSIEELSLGTSPYSKIEAEEKTRLAIEQGPQVFVWHSRRSNGELFWSEVSLRAGVIGGERRLISATRDITGRVQAAEALRVEEERLRLALEASNQGWFDINVQTGVGRASAEYARIVGREAVDYAVSAQEWLAGVHADDRAGVAAAYEDCVATGQSRTFEYRRKVASGEWKWIRSIGKIVQHDGAGKPLRMLGTHTDITQRKELEERLLHTQRLESVATLAGGVAHDLNNILTPMLMVTGVFHRKLTDPRDRELMAGVEAGAKRGAAIVRQLLVFSRSLAHERTAVDLAELVRETARAVREKNAGKIAVVESAEPELWPIKADLEQIRQVLASLCTNACEAMPHGGRLTLRVENTRQSPRATTSNPWGKGGPCVVVTVRDTGTGIAPEVIGRIFDPFFTTKEIGRGSGLGLSSVHGIVTGHGGTVEVESQQGQGATFRVFLPATVKRQSLAKPAQSGG